MFRRRCAALLLAAAALALAACAAPAPTPASSPSSSAAGDELGGDLVVYAAASLQGAFDEISAAFEERYPGVSVSAVYDGSSTLVTQLTEGAPADVFASADEANMDKVADLVVDPELFATNTLVIAVPAANPAGVRDLQDLADVTTVLCAPEVPCGAASQKLLDAAGVSVAPASVEQNVTAVLTKVATGEADAGLVYATDVKGDDAVESIVPAGAADVVNRYPIAALADAPNPNAADVFVAFVRSDDGQAILSRFGFGAP
jgi:molybdate transport system substrate-binding protein